MTNCSACGAPAPDNKKLCNPCIQAKIRTTWQKQMRMYGIVTALGAMLLLYDISEVCALPHDGGGIPLYLMGGAALGGLALLGGLFGLALALFFHYWHRKKGV